MGYDVTRIVLASDVANAGTFTVGYQYGKDAGAYQGGRDHKLVSNTYGEMSVQNGKASFSFGASNVTITNASGVTLLAGTEIYVQFDQPGGDRGFAYPLAAPERMAEMSTILISLGAPDVADADGACASQSVSSGVAAAINGALAVDGVAIFDVPRNVVAGWTTSAVITVTGTDEFGNVVVEQSASGTSFAGKKAFKTVTRVTFSANVTSATVGTGDVLGLPVFLADIGRVFRELQDGSAATAGTVVAGVKTKATATTGDVRGTYDPNAACDGSKVFQLGVIVGEPNYNGVPQYAG
ncbi:MAG: hypothetical protein KAX54_00225 [Thauera sp.]|nr:hypothetical protein [Thauera sp.]